MFSVIIPHKHGKLNDECLALCLKMLKENTRNDYDVLVDDRNMDPYQIWNETVPLAKGEVVVMSNTDVLMAPGWDEMVLHAAPNAIVTGYLVECGAIGVHQTNIEKDFGRTPAAFNRDAFEKFVAINSNDKPAIKEERGWYMPCAMNREWFRQTGGFDTGKGRFPAPLDIYFWESCLKHPSFRLLRAKSYAYHFQNLSNETRVKR